MNYEPRVYSNLQSVQQLMDCALMHLYESGHLPDSYSDTDTNRIVDAVMRQPNAQGLSRDIIHKKVREGLQAMSALGIVEQTFKSNVKTKAPHRWRLAKLEWNRDNPYNLIPGQGGSSAAILKPAPGAETVSAEAYSEVVDKNQKLIAKMEDLKQSCEQTLEEIQRVEAENAKLKAENATASQRARVIKVERWDGTKLTLKDQILPKYFDDLKDLVECRMNVMLVGPAGAGKTHAAEMVAKVLGLEFEAVSCSAGMSEAHLTGRVRPKLTGDDLFQTTGFLEMYENGGIMLLDELDAADPNLLLVINTALANRYCNVPNRDSNRKARRHPNFVCIATANTYGRGATRMYSGRNQIDEATLDRFRIGLIEVDYDRVVEEALCPDEQLRKWCWLVREGIEKAQLRRIMSTRFMRDAYVLATQKKWPMTKIQNTFFNGWGLEEKNKVLVQMVEASKPNYAPIPPVRQFPTY